MVVDNNEDYLSISMENFKLQPIKDIYQDYNQGKPIYFLDENKNPIKVTDIEKIPYSGRMYDVDVPNDVILVERNGLIVWSGIVIMAVII